MTTKVKAVPHAVSGALSVLRHFALACVFAGLCLPPAGFAQAAPPRQDQPASQTQEPSTAPAPPPTPEQMPSQLPTVTFRDGELTIVAYNSTLRDVLEMVRSQTGAVLDIPPEASERVFVRLGPAPAHRVIESLLAGSSFNYVLLGSPADPQALSQLILTPKPKDAAENPTRAASLMPTRSSLARARQQAQSEEAEEQQAEEPAPAKESLAATISKPGDAAGSPELANAATADYPHTPNIKSTQDVLLDLYARRRQSMEQQRQQPTPP